MRADPAPLKGHQFDFLADGGEMGARIRAFPWAATSLGPPQHWPSSLRTSLRILLTTQHPVFIFWGEQLSCFYNDAYSRSLGPEKHSSILGIPARDAWPEIWHIIGPQIDQVMRGDGATWHENALVPILRHGALEDVYWTYSYGPIDEPSTPTGVGGVLVICSETTPQVQSERRKDEFLAMLAHELRNPLAPIRNAAELLSRRLVHDDMALHAAEVVKRQSEQLTRLVDDLLDVSRISMGHVELKQETLPLSEVIELAIETAAPLWRAKGHEITRHAAPEDVYVQGDRARLVQIFGNVMNNSAKYTDEGGRIGIRVAATADTVKISIEDSGVGISAEFMPRLFDLFAQADRTLDRSQGGLGIGLPVVKKLVEMHGGAISAQSEGLGSGSTFEITLPRVAEPTEHAAERSAGTAAPRRVLIVDDNTDAANSLSELLRLDGHTTRPVFSAADALSNVASFAPDVVLLDIGLPGIDGYEVARRLRQTTLSRGTRIIALTGYGQAEDRERTRAAGFDDHLVKPVDLAALATLLARPASP
jgi:signal transduction histidine kinase/CheY-like chemotaxis protein